MNLQRKIFFSIIIDFLIFIFKFNYFILINCISEQRVNGGKEFCQFVETRIRLQLTFQIDVRGGIVEAQLYPKIYQENCKISSHLVTKNFRYFLNLNYNNIFKTFNI